jgi:hypothetical protein
MSFFRSPAGSAIVAFIAIAAGGADLADGSRVLGAILLVAGVAIAIRRVFVPLLASRRTGR